MQFIQALALWCGIGTGVFAVIAMWWSYLRPGSRVWPPRTDGQRFDWIVWPVTFAHFGAVVVLAVMDWNALGWPASLRWGLGGLLLLVGHLAMIPSVRQFGYAQTSGADTRLFTGGLYRFSRNPQYVGDIAILLGWCVLSASPLVMMVASWGILAFLIAPLAEEPWLLERYGQDYANYSSRVRRFV